MADNVLIHFRPYLGQTCQNIHKRVPLIVVQRLIVLRRWEQPAESDNRSTPCGVKAKAILRRLKGSLGAVWRQESGRSGRGLEGEPALVLYGSGAVK